MLTLRSALAATALLGVGCFAEPQPPPNFRYACERDSQCDGPEACVRGLCQIPCSIATASDDCASDPNAVGCVNGYCASACLVDDDNCPGDQECYDVGGALGGGNPFGGTTERVGLCGEPCGDDDCREDVETCIEGFCVPTCDVDDPRCPSDGLTCVGGLCLPDGAADPDDGSETGETEEER